MEHLHKYKVATQCFTYNQSSYIKDTLDGFVMQRTDFPVVFVIVDDASTDGEQDYLNKWANLNLNYNHESAFIRDTEYSRIFYAPHKDASNSFFAILLLHNNLYRQPDLKLSYITEWCDNAKYIAICEGDDFWKDPLKLQIQVNFLEQNNDYSFCFGDAMYFNSDINRSKGNIGLVYRKKNCQLETLAKKDVFYRILCGKCLIPTLTVLYRKDLYESIESNAVEFMMSDTPLWLDLSQKGKIKYFNRVFGVYRIHENSVTRSNRDRRLLFDLSKMEMRIFYCDKYKYLVPPSIKKSYNRAISRLLVSKMEFDYLYDYFAKNVFQKWHFKMLKNNKYYSSILKKIFSPIDDFVVVLRIKIGIVLSVIWNKLENSSKTD